MDINTHVPFGSSQITYPHVTMKDEKKRIIHFVTTSQRLASVGDVIFDSFDARTSSGNIETKYLQKKAMVISVDETRPAKGTHREGVEAIYQKLSY